LKGKLAHHHRFYISPEFPDESGVVRFSKAESRHMLSSLRVRKGDCVTAGDGRGNVYRLEIEDTSGREVSARVAALESIERKGPAVGLFQAAIKPAAMKLVVEKATELGLRDFVPVVASHSEAGVGRIKMDRLRRAAIEAMKQSLGSYLPDLHEPVGFDDALEMMKDFDSIMVAWEGEEDRPLHRLVRSRGKGRIALWIGPAGGFTEAELVKLRECGGMTFTLGRPRLKSETAAIASLTILNHLFKP
jgi:16S rRNA (uracil1498-N3)-methyltransferase